MTADGRWKAEVNSPMGVQKFTLNLQTAGDSFTGTLSGAMGSQEIAGKVDGNTLSWSTELKEPMPLTLEYKVRVDGDALSGEVKAGAFGSSPLKGSRATGGSEEKAEAPAEPIDFKKGLDFDPDALRAHYAEEFEKGRATSKK